MADRESSKRTATSLANGSDDLSAPESSSRNQLIALGLIALGLITIVGAVFFARDECAQPTIGQKLSLMKITTLVLAAGLDMAASSAQALRYPLLAGPNLS